MLTCINIKQSVGFVLWFYGIYGNGNASSGPDPTMDSLCSHLLFHVSLFCRDVIWFWCWDGKECQKYVLNNQPSNLNNLSSTSINWPKNSATTIKMGFRTLKLFGLEWLVCRENNLNNSSAPFRSEKLKDKGMSVSTCICVIMCIWMS